jgi:hypothetical protein
MAEAILKIAVIKDHERELAELEKADNEVHFTEQHNRRMDKMFKRERVRRLTTKVCRIAYRSAAVLLIAFAAFSSAIMLNGEVRATVQTVIVEWFDTHTSFRYVNEPVDPVSVEWNLGYVPDGFAKTMSLFELGATEIRYEAADGSAITFRAFPLGSGTVSVDNENAGYRETIYKDVSYSIFESANADFPSVIIWDRGGYNFILTSFLDSGTMLEMADSVVQRKK